MGEAFYLEKPVLAIPEPGNFEQMINGHFVEQSGCGLSVEMEQVSPGLLRHFMNTLDYYRSNIDPERQNGNKEALRIINSHMGISNTPRPSIPAQDEGRAVS